MKTQNTASLDRYICTPFSEKSVQTESVGEGAIKAFRVKNTKSLLTPLRVLVDASVQVGGSPFVVKAGSTVFLRANDYSQPWAKEVLTAEGWADEHGPVEFIVVPGNRVEMVEFSE